jgi:hypothetical protein
MDEKHLEFWGNFLLNAARGKKQMDEFTNTIRKNLDEFSEITTQKGVSTMNEMMEMYRKMFGFDQLSDRGLEFNRVAMKAVQDFQASFKDYLGLLGIVSRDEHLSLVEKYEKLKLKCETQEETIRHLQMLLNAKSMDQGDVVSSFQEIVKDQGELFQDMMKSFGKYFPKPSDDKSRKGEPKDGNDEPQEDGETDG